MTRSVNVEGQSGLFEIRPKKISICCLRDNIALMKQKPGPNPNTDPDAKGYFMSTHRSRHVKMRALRRCLERRSPSFHSSCADTFPHHALLLALILALTCLPAWMHTLQFVLLAAYFFSHIGISIFNFSLCIVCGSFCFRLSVLLVRTHTHTHTHTRARAYTYTHNKHSAHNMSSVVLRALA